MRGIHRWPDDFPHKNSNVELWYLPLLIAWRNYWTNSRIAVIWHVTVISCTWDAPRIIFFIKRWWPGESIKVTSNPSVWKLWWWRSIVRPRSLSGFNLSKTQAYLTESLSIYKYRCATLQPLHNTVDFLDITVSSMSPWAYLASARGIHFVKLLLKCCACVLCILLEIKLLLQIKTHWGRVTLICVSKLGHIWFRWWLAACSAPSHYLNQCWYIYNWTTGNIF